MPLMTGLSEIKENSAVAIGNFDGFHLGHQKIVEVLRALAEEHQLRSVLMTFFPHPLVYFGRRIRLIETDRQRRDGLARHPVDFCFFIGFEQVASMDPVEFVRDVLVARLRMKILIVSRDFRFGRMRRGDIGCLKDESVRFGFEVKEVEPQTIDGLRVSSTLIRRRLEAGFVADARRMLGRPYCIDGIVRKGTGRGKRLGFPTLNIETDNQILPTGVFHTKTEIGGLTFESVTNIGLCPTFANRKRTVETYVIGFDREVYGKSVRVCFQNKIRNERKFKSGADLGRQIARDIESVAFDKKALF